MVVSPDVLAGATIFGAIFAIGVWLNGKRTIAKLGGKLDSLGAKMDSGFSDLKRLLEEISSQNSVQRSILQEISAKLGPR